MGLAAIGIQETVEFSLHIPANALLFTTLADRSGLAECVLFPDVYRSHAGAVRGQVVRIEGRVDESLGAITLVAEQARSLAGGD